MRFIPEFESSNHILVILVVMSSIYCHLLLIKSWDFLCSWSDSLRAMLNSRTRKRSLSARHTEEYKVCCPTASLLTHIAYSFRTQTNFWPLIASQHVVSFQQGWRKRVHPATSGSIDSGGTTYCRSCWAWSVTLQQPPPEVSLVFVQVYVMPFRVSCDFWLDRCHEKILGSRATNKEVMSETNCEIS